MLLNQILAKPLKQLSVPLDDCLLLLTSHFLNIIILFLKSFEYIVELFLLRQNLDDSPQESAIDVLHKSLAISVNYFPRMFQSQNSRYNVRELLFIHLFKQLGCVLIQTLFLAL